MAVYLPQITTLPQVREELAEAARKFEEAEPQPEENLRRTIGALTDDAIALHYAERLDLVHRFVVAELDTDAPSKRGMARLADGDPPPRIGFKYRKKLRDEEARNHVGVAVERLILVGFASQQAFAGSPFADPPPEDVWLLWLRHIIDASNELHDSTSRLRNGEQSGVSYGAMMFLIYSEHGFAELIEEFEGRGIVRAGRDSWSNARAFSYWMLLFGAGRALAHVLSDAVDPSANSYQPQHLLENYAEKRNKRQLKAEI